MGTLRKRNAYEAFIVDDAKIGMVSIRDILRAKHVHSRKASSLVMQIPNLTPETVVREAAAIMTDYRVRALPIVKDGEAIGEITAPSICKALDATTVLDFTIDKVMMSHPITARVDDPLAKAKTLMSRGNIDHLPVLEDSKTVGVVLSHRLLDPMMPPERSMRYGWTPETRALRVSIGGYNLLLISAHPDVSEHMEWERSLSKRFPSSIGHVDVTYLSPKMKILIDQQKVSLGIIEERLAQAKGRRMRKTTA